MRFLFFLIMLLSSCSAKADCPPVPAPPGGPSIPSAQPELKNEINKQRSLRGLPVLVSTPSLDCAALLLAQDMNNFKFCSHTGSDGSRFWERAQKCGTRASGEIIGCGHTDHKILVQDWTRSPGHASIMYDRRQVAMGAARVGNYWVVIFMK